MGRKRRARKGLACVLGAALATALGGCAPRVDTHGNLADPERLAQIAPGKQNRGQVAELLGSPSSTAVFDNEVWYYISQRTETFAFFEPKVAERQIVIVEFDKDGVVSAVKTSGLEDGNDIEPVERVTPTEGKRLTVLEQIIGNLGRFGR